MWCEKWYCTIWAKTTSRLCTVKDIKLVIYSKNWIPENSGLKSEKIDTTLFFPPKMSLKKAEKNPKYILLFYFILLCIFSTGFCHRFLSDDISDDQKIGYKVWMYWLASVSKQELVYSYLVPDLLIITNIITDEWTAEPGGENAFW